MHQAYQLSGVVIHNAHTPSSRSGLLSGPLFEPTILLTLVHALFWTWALATEPGCALL